MSGEGAGNYTIGGGTHIFNSAVSGTDGGAVTFTEAMRINSAGELLVGYTADNGAYKLQVNNYQPRDPLYDSFDVFFFEDMQHLFCESDPSWN